MDIVQIVITLFAPLLFLSLKETKIISAISPVVCCYIVGILFANLGFDVSSNISKMATDASVPLAIPLLLLGTNFVGWFRLARPTVISFVLIVITVCLVSAFVSLGFKDELANYWQLAGMMVGVYTGGTPNLTAIGLALNVDENVFVLMNGADLVLGAGYLLFILTFGVKIMGFFLPAFKYSSDNKEVHYIDPWESLTLLNKMAHFFGLIGLSGIFLGISIGLSQLFFGRDEVAFIILIITSFGIAFSFFQKVRAIKGSYEVGQYLLLVFCVAIGTMANIEQLMKGSMTYVLLLGIVMFLSISIHVFLCRLFKIDRDTAIITSVAGIFGPPFVGPVAERLGNREIVVSGLTSGLIGYAVGNYLGIAVAYIVKSL